MSARGPFSDLGLRRTENGWELRVWSRSASRIEVEVFTAADPQSPRARLALARGLHDIWSVRSAVFEIDGSYRLFVDGPEGDHHSYDPLSPLMDPYSLGVGWFDGEARSTVVDESFDWGGSTPPNIPLDLTVIYEAHVKGFSQQNPAVPESLRGSYAGLAHESSIDYLKRLGVTSIELLPIHAFATEGFISQGDRVNYWGYNTIGFFAPHASYASPGAQAAGPSAVLAEVKHMVRSLHEAGLEVILDVVYNHTGEEGPDGPRFHLRGIDNEVYYRQDAHGNYADTTGCGNALYFGNRAPMHLVLDSMRYWATELQIDGFRLDLAVTLGRGQDGDFSREHPLINAMLLDPVLRSCKLIAEPWDVGWGGWQTGNFPEGFSEWNDRYRDRMRDFWLSDLRQERETGLAGSGIGRFATRIAGSADLFREERGPLASVNFVTAHDGFTLADLVSFDRKHNEANGENNRDGSDNNSSYNHGVEGPTLDETVNADRRLSMRNLLGTLLLSAGVPMLTAGDEYGRTQGGNNNGYAQDNAITWLVWNRDEHAIALQHTVETLTRLCRDNPALRPVRFARFGETVPTASQMDWYNAAGETMSEEQWDDPTERTLQYLAASTPRHERLNRTLLVVHASDRPQTVVLPEHIGVSGYRLLWDSWTEAPPVDRPEFVPGDELEFAGRSMRLFVAF